MRSLKPREAPLRKPTVDLASRMQNTSDHLNMQTFYMFSASTYTYTVTWRKTLKFHSWMNLAATVNVNAVVLFPKIALINLVPREIRIVCIIASKAVC